MELTESKNLSGMIKKYGLINIIKKCLELSDEHEEMLCNYKVKEKRR